ncbi:MAG: hypothetical protein SGI88_10295 [Candidatus Hydrogenedentes bacterium]|nr:hypothetical protein [Candidatus Hydrogenedentota bacterium]
MGFFLVLKAEVVRSMIVTRRYWFATMTALLVACVMFYGFINIFLSGLGLGASMAGVAVDRALGLVIGIFAFSIVGMFSSGLAGMARSGELEQVYMSPHGLITNFMARSAVATVLSIITWTILLMFISAAFSEKGDGAPAPTQTAHAEGVPTATPTKGPVADVEGKPGVKSAPDGKIHANPAAVSVLFLLTYFSMTGFGFMVGGLVLVFKQIGQVAVILRMAMMAVAWKASDGLYDLPLVLRSIAHAVPVTDAAICLKLVLLQNYGMHIFIHPSFMFLLLNVAVWTPIGLVCFKAMENWARSRGTLGAF